MRSDTLMKNIGKNYIFTLFFNLNLTRGIWMIYLARRGFTLLELGIFEGVFHITSFLMEVPTGVVADLWGRKTSRLWGRVMFFISLIIMYCSGSFYLQAAGFAFCAMGYNLESGAGEALVYDSMLLSGEKEKYKGVAGKQELILQTAFILSYLAGGYLAVKSYFSVFIISAVFAAAAFAAALTFVEPVLKNRKKNISIPDIFRSMTVQTSGSITVIKKTPRIAFFILFSEIIFTFIVSLFFYLQNYWKGEGRSEFYIGIVFAVSAFTAGLTGYKAHAIERKLGERGVLLYLPALLILCLWGTALTSYKEIFYIMTGIIEGVLVVAISDYLNRLIPSENRATVLSFQNMAFSFFMIIVFPFIGWIGDNYSLPAAFIIMSAAGSLMYVFFLILLNKTEKGVL